MIKPSKYCAGYHAAIGKALGLGDRPYRSLVLREAANSIVTVTVEFIVTAEQGDRLIEAIEERRYYLSEAKDPVMVSVTQ